MSSLIFRKSNSRRSFPLGLRCAKMGLTYFENVRFVMIPYRCISASSTVRSSLRLLGTGRLWVFTGLSFLGVRHTLNWVLIPMSRRWWTRMSLNSLLMESRVSRSSPVIDESSHLDTSTILVLNFPSYLGSSCSNFCSSPNSVRMRCWIVYVLYRFRHFQASQTGN